MNVQCETEQENGIMNLAFIQLDAAQTNCTTKIQFLTNEEGNNIINRTFYSLKITPVI